MKLRAQALSGVLSILTINIAEARTMIYVADMDWATASGALVIVVSIFLAWWFVPIIYTNKLKRTIRDVKTRLDIQDNLRRTIGQLATALAVLCGAAFAYIQFITAQRAAESMRLTQQVSKGFEQLGSKELMVRVGGVYALEGAMNEAESYHGAILEALCDFISNESHSEDDTVHADIRAAITVLSRRKRGFSESRINIRNANLSRIELRFDKMINQNENGGFYILKPEDYNIDVVPNFVRASLKNVNLRNAILRYVSLMYASVFDTDFRMSDISNGNFQSAYITRSNFSGSDMRNANLFVAEISDSDLTDADLRDADLRGVEISRSRLTRVNLAGANLFGATLKGVDMSQVVGLTQAQLEEACGNVETKLPKDIVLKPCTDK